MSADSTPHAPPAHGTQLTQGLILLFAFSCGAIVANLYYAQPITELIAPGLHMSGGTASLIVSLTQIGYALGLFFIVPLGDLLENRKLMIVTAVVSIASLAAAARAHTGLSRDFAADRLQLGGRADPRAARRASRAGSFARPRGRHDHERAAARHPAGPPAVERRGRRVRLAFRVRGGRRADDARHGRARADDSAAPARPSRDLFRADRLAAATGPHDARPAPSRVLPGPDVRVVQPVLDRRAGRADASLRIVAVGHRPVRAGRGDRRDVGTGGRAPRGRRPYGARDADRAGRRHAVVRDRVRARHRPVRSS